MDTARAEPLPAYLRIAEMLSRDIAAGRLSEGQRLAPERELAPQLGVSVGTLRKALAELEGRGLLVRRHGSGNYIRFDARAAAGYSMFRLELIDGPGQPHSVLIAAERVMKPADFAALGPAPDALRFRRLRHLSGKPVALEDIWIDGRHGDPDDTGALAGSLYRYYQRAYGLWILAAEDRVGGGTVPDWAPGAFGPRPGAVLPRIDRTAWDQDGRVAEMSITHFDPGLARYVARIP
ncbi:UTRA domain-containing protein [Rhodobacterales bacterium HKCCE3408]|nr:UTRA domain-containing protein [Rhodobacterales bacterium HKCCE3408]